MILELENRVVIVLSAERFAEFFQKAWNDLIESNLKF